MCTYSKSSYIVMLLVNDSSINPRKKKAMEVDGEGRCEGHSPTVPPT